MAHKTTGQPLTKRDVFTHAPATQRFRGQILTELEHLEHACALARLAVNGPEPRRAATYLRSGASDLLRRLKRPGVEASLLRLKKLDAAVGRRLLHAARAA